MKSGKKTISFIVAGAGSGSGKTVLTLGIMEALRRASVTVQPFKTGPDYIDPGHHSLLLKRPSYNLDAWMMGPEAVKKTFMEKTEGVQAAVVEGVMGLFDGRAGGEEGSSAHLARLLDIPVLLVIDASKTSRSAGAVIKGFEAYDPKVAVRWAVFNRVAGPRHFKMLRDSVPKGSKVRVIGYLPKDDALTMPERHLGLLTPDEVSKKDFRRLVNRACALVGRFIDIRPLLRGLPEKGVVSARRPKGAPNPVTIAVARDRAFSFYYEENLEMLEDFGARLVFFSPMKDERLPKGACGLYLGGGYPEVHARALEANAGLRKEIRRMAEKGLPVLAECGGLMYLGRSLEDLEGRRRMMAGVFAWQTRMLKKRKALGYREVKLNKDCPMLKSGALRGHEYHYSELTKAPARIKKAFTAIGPDGRKAEGYVNKNTLATYIHMHFASNPGFAAGFVERCREFKDGNS